MQKSWYGLGLGLGMLILLVTQVPETKTKIVACDVGQGDAILISKGNNQVLVDGGPSGEKILACLERQIPFWDRTIELIVLTHTDYDHMNGLSAVIERYSLGEFVTADGVHEGRALDKLRKVLVEKGVEAAAVEQGDVIKVGREQEGEQLELQVLWPPEVERRYLAVFGNEIGEAETQQILGASAKRGNINERSVVLLLTEGGYRALLTGDAGVQTEKELLIQRLVPQIDYLKVGHHGSKYSTSLEFLEAVQPKVAVISVGRKNRYGHPAPEVLSRLKELEIEIRRTDEEGDVVVRID